MNEERAIVLDFLPQGKSSSFKPEPLALVVGTAHFSLLEVVPKANVELKPMEEVYIGREARDKIDHIKRRVNYDDLTSTAKEELEKVVEKIIMIQEKKFVQFFNAAGSISLKRHQLELLPGIGKQHLEDILRERQTKPFESLKDIETRVKFLTSPIAILRRHIINELQGEEKFYLFARPPQSDEPEMSRGRRFR